MAKPPTEIGSFARAYAKHAIQTLSAIAQRGEDEGARVRAAAVLLDRGYGKPKQTLEHTGENGGAIQVEIVMREKKKK